MICTYEKEDKMASQINARGQNGLFSLLERTIMLLYNWVRNMTLKEIRIAYNLSQIDAANIVGVPVRTLRRYESDETYGSLFKRHQFIDILNNRFEITEEKGLLSIERIKLLLTNLFNEHYKDKVNFCYLFGSYAKGYATETSDVDLCVSSSLTGIKVAGLAESIRGVLHKKIDLIRFDTLSDNFELINEIMKEGIKIYG